MDCTSSVNFSGFFFSILKQCFNLFGILLHIEKFALDVMDAQEFLQHLSRLFGTFPNSFGGYYQKIIRIL